MINFSTVRWSDYTFDECPHCGKHTGFFPTTYNFNVLEVTDCPHCKGHMVNDYLMSKGFFWIKTNLKLEMFSGSTTRQ